MMRPYQIYAVKAIIDCIDQNSGNGYIWHTTGSGKTLTSFKTSTLLKTNESIHKCLFVVDRKDLDRQTREEFNRFQENCVEENTNTAALVRRLQSDDYADKVIVTTIQKLGLALDENSKHSKPEHCSGSSQRSSSGWGSSARSGWCSSSTNVTARSSVIITRPSRIVLSELAALRLHGYTDLRGQRDRKTDRAETTATLLTTQGPLPESSSTPTPSPMRSRIGTSFVFMLTTTSQTRHFRPEARRDPR